MSAQDQFRSFLAGVAPDLQAAGFKRRGGVFRRDVPGFAQFVTYQKSRDSDRETILFTVNLGVDLEALHFLAARHNSIHDCPWHTRLGHLLEARRDYWWTLNDKDDPQELVLEHLRYIQSPILPTLVQVAAVDYLVKLWRGGSAPGLTEGQRRVFLAVLLKLRARPDDAAMADELLADRSRLPAIALEFEDVLGLPSSYLPEPGSRSTDSEEVS